jgi:dolichol-phosphate mannosyltransferase
MFKKPLQTRIFKFLMSGGIAAVINLISIAFLIQRIGFDTPVLRNLANLISIEASLIASFFIYRIWVWTGGNWTIQDVLWRQLPLYHVANGLPVITRIFLIFPILDWLKVNYAINTLIGVIMGAILNYLISDRLVFQDLGQKNNLQTPGETASDLYYPEGLEPALAGSSNIRPQLRSYSKTDVLSIVIPAYNEEGCIVPTVEAISQLLEEEKIPYEIWLFGR